jgi:hypothetical protein
VVPDNAKPLVTKVERFDVTLNRTYQAFAAHYGVAIVPARPRKPRDKGPAEAGVLLVERWILARLRHEPFTNWETARAAVRTLLDPLNAHPFVTEGLMSVPTKGGPFPLAACEAPRGFGPPRFLSLTVPLKELVLSTLLCIDAHCNTYYTNRGTEESGHEVIFVTRGLAHPLGRWLDD